MQNENNNTNELISDIIKMISNVTKMSLRNTT